MKYVTSTLSLALLLSTPLVQAGKNRKNNSSGNLVAAGQVEAESPNIHQELGLLDTLKRDQRELETEIEQFDTTIASLTTQKNATRKQIESLVLQASTKVAPNPETVSDLVHRNGHINGTARRTAELKTLESESLALIESNETQKQIPVKALAELMLRIQSLEPSALPPCFKDLLAQIKAGKSLARTSAKPTYIFTDYAKVITSILLTKPQLKKQSQSQVAQFDHNDWTLPYIPVAQRHALVLKNIEKIETNGNNLKPASNNQTSNITNDKVTTALAQQHDLNENYKQIRDMSTNYDKYTRVLHAINTQKPALTPPPTNEELVTRKKHKTTHNASTTMTTPLSPLPAITNFAVHNEQDQSTILPIPAVVITIDENNGNNTESTASNNNVVHNETETILTVAAAPQQDQPTILPIPAVVIPGNENNGNNNASTSSSAASDEQNLNTGDIVYNGIDAVYETTSSHSVATTTNEDDFVDTAKEKDANNASADTTNTNPNDQKPASKGWSSYLPW